MKRSETHQHIVETASRLFYQRGYNLTGINEIIAEAGIAKATLYNHFKSKDELCLAYLDMRHEDLMINLEKFCMLQPKGTDRLVGVLEFLLPFFEQDGFAGCWCIRTVAEVPQEKEEIRERIRDQKKQFLGFIRRLVEQNHPDLTSPAQAKLSDRIYLLYEAAVAESHLHDSAWPIRECISMLKSILKK